MSSPTLTMNDGRPIPQVGFGSAFFPPKGVDDYVRTAIEAGYRHIDSAKAYDNEALVGEGIRASGVPRSDLFVTSKLSCEDQGYDSARLALEGTLSRMGFDYLDLYLVHWPSHPLDRTLETWRAMIRLREEGLVRSIGVSNFEPEHLDGLVSETGVAPAVNQVELHPRLQQRAVREAGARHGVLTECWSPLVHGHLLSDPVFGEIARKHGRSPAQVVLRWHVQNGLVVVPRAERREWMEENLAVFDFVLDAEDMTALAALDQGEPGRMGPHPRTTPQERFEIVGRIIAAMNA